MILSNESTSGTLVRLTAAENSQCGAVWWNDQLGLATKAFEVEFAFRITDASGGPATSGADGFAFVIQSQSGDAIGQGTREKGNSLSYNLIDYFIHKVVVSWAMVVCRRGKAKKNSVLLKELTDEYDSLAIEFDTYQR